jgi:hypothetical protein
MIGFEMLPSNENAQRLSFQRRLESIIIAFKILDSSLRWNDILCYLMSIFIRVSSLNPNKYWIRIIFQNYQYEFFNYWAKIASVKHTGSLFYKKSFPFLLVGKG